MDVSSIYRLGRFKIFKTKTKIFIFGIRYRYNHNSIRCITTMIMKSRVLLKRWKICRVSRIKYVQMPTCVNSTENLRKISLKIRETQTEQKSAKLDPERLSRLRSLSERPSNPLPRKNALWGMIWWCRKVWTFLVYLQVGMYRIGLPIWTIYWGSARNIDSYTCPA